LRWISDLPRDLCGRHLANHGDTTRQFRRALDRLSGYSDKSQFDPSINLVYLPRFDTTLHAGFARYMQVPSFQGISPGAPTVFAGTTGFAGTGTVNPETEDDYEWDAGIVHQVMKHLTVSEDGFYEYTSARPGYCAGFRTCRPQSSGPARV
jgi:outer membrane receptor protein involved in Fe transport